MLQRADERRSRLELPALGPTRHLQPHGLRRPFIASQLGQDINMVFGDRCLLRDQQAKQPIGLQLLGRPFDEATLLRAAYAYEHDTEWSRRRPAL